MRKIAALGEDADQVGHDVVVPDAVRHSSCRSAEPGPSRTPALGTIPVPAFTGHDPIASTKLLCRTGACPCYFFPNGGKQVAKVFVSKSELTEILWRNLRTCPQCP